MMRWAPFFAATALLLGTAVPIAASAQDTAAGQRVFNQCRSCHTINAGGRNGVGPNLHGVWERAAAKVEGFRYSAPMREKAAAGLVWTEDNLRAYLRDPKAVIPAGAMSFAGVKNDQQLADLLAYVKQASTAQ